MWHFNGEDNAARCGRKGPKTPAALAKILAELYKGEKEEFTRLQCQDGFSMYNPPSWLRSNPTILLLSLNYFQQKVTYPLAIGMAEGYRGDP